MNAALAIPRKDAHLAGIIVWPWAVVLGMVLLVCLIGHLLPGGLELLWGHHTEVPPLTERMYPAAVLASLACYLVPAWAAVLVALGDRARQAELLAAVAPVSDVQKIGSKLGIVLGVAAGVWLVWLALAVMAGELVDGELNLVAAMAVAIGLCSGLGAAALVRRAVPAVVISAVLPFIGLPVAWAASAVSQHVLFPMIDAGMVGGADWSNDADAPARAFRFYSDMSWVVAGACVVLVLGVRGVPYLAGRHPRLRPIRGLGVAVGVACVALLAWGAVISAWHPLLTATRATVALKNARMRGVAEAHDDYVLYYLAGPEVNAFHPNAELQFIAVLEPRINPSTALRDALEQLSPRPLPLDWEEHSLLRDNLRRRLVDSTSKMRLLIDTQLAAGKMSPMRRLRIAELVGEKEGALIAAQLLAEAPSEAAHLAALVFLAGGKLGHINDEPSKAKHLPSDWCECIRFAEETIEEALHGAPERTDRPAVAPPSLIAGEQVILERALKHVNRPHPVVADFLEQLPEWKCAPGLECIRSGRVPAAENER